MVGPCTELDGNLAGFSDFLKQKKRENKFCIASLEYNLYEDEYKCLLEDNILCEFCGYNNNVIKEI